jgi:hypothetical protein
MEEYKKEFLDIFDTYIKREGAETLRDYLVKSDFFTAPASSRFHSAVRGGLCLHSLYVYKRLSRSVAAEYGEAWAEHVSRETVAICGLLHDVCKIEFYKEDVKNVKEDGQWVTKPYYSHDEKLPYGHGEKSVYIINGFIRLTREEAMAINWHMGGFDLRVKGGDYSIGEAMNKFPLTVLLHVADLTSTYIDEKTTK